MWTLTKGTDRISLGYWSVRIVFESNMNLIFGVQLRGPVSPSKWPRLDHQMSILHWSVLLLNFSSLLQVASSILLIPADHHTLPVTSLRIQVLGWNNLRLVRLVLGLGMSNNACIWALISLWGCPNLFSKSSMEC